MVDKDLQQLVKEEVIANTEKLKVEKDSIQYRDSLETVKLFIYGFIASSALIASVVQVIILIVGKG